jgi:hypothetical protein
MPLNDTITVVTYYQAPPLGVPSLQIPQCAFLPTGGQRSTWTGLYGSSRVVEITPASWQTTLTALGVTAGEDIHVALTDLFSQRIGNAPAQPSTVLLALRATPVAQVRTATVAVVGGGGNYTTTINGTDFVVPFDTDAATTATAIRSAINAGSEPVTASGAGASVVLTADEAGVPFTSDVEHSTTPGDYTIATTTASVGLPEDITAWDAEDGRAYFLLETTRTSGNIRAAAEAWETRTGTRPGQFWAQTDDSAAQGAGSTDIASELIALGLTRTRLFWHDDDDEFVDWAACGKTCAYPPGVPNQQWMRAASVTGIAAPTLTSTTNLRNKRYTWLESSRATVPPTSTLQGGQMLDGNWVDLVHGADAVSQTIQIRVYTALSDGNIPYFGGEEQIANAILGAVAEFEGPLGRAFLVAGETRVTVPPAASQTDNNRLARTYAGIQWSAPAQGKVNRVQIEGFLAQ